MGDSRREETKDQDFEMQEDVGHVGVLFANVPKPRSEIRYESLGSDAQSLGRKMVSLCS